MEQPELSIFITDENREMGISEAVATFNNLVENSPAEVQSTLGAMAEDPDKSPDGHPEEIGKAVLKILELGASNRQLDYDELTWNEIMKDNDWQTARAAMNRSTEGSEAQAKQRKVMTIRALGTYSARRAQYRALNSPVQ